LRPPDPAPVTTRVPPRSRYNRPVMGFFNRKFRLTALATTGG